MDALDLLQADHVKVKRLLNELESTTERGVKTRAELFSTIKGELTLHEIIEEEIFYPELKAHPKAEAVVLEAFEDRQDLGQGAAGCLVEGAPGRRVIGRRWVGGC